MKLEVQHKPRSRGVSQLMYVGDDGTPETPCVPRAVVVVGVIALLAWALHRTK